MTLGSCPSITTSTWTCALQDCPRMILSYYARYTRQKIFREHYFWWWNWGRKTNKLHGDALRMKLMLCFATIAIWHYLHSSPPFDRLLSVSYPACSQYTNNSTCKQYKCMDKNGLTFIRGHSYNSIITTIAQCIISLLQIQPQQCKRTKSWRIHCSGRQIENS